MKKIGVLLVIVLAVQAVHGEIIDEVVFQLDNLNVTSSFDYGAGVGGNGMLTWSGGSFAEFRHGGMPPVSTMRCNVIGTFDDTTNDPQPGGRAGAIFNIGSFSVTMYALSDIDKLNPIGGVSGELYSSAYRYLERETQEDPSELYGAAIVRITDFNVPGFQWSETVGIDKAGMTASTTSLTPTNIDDYLADWSSNNTIVTVLADESGIPEPSTILLMSLGGLALLKRSKS